MQHLKISSAHVVRLLSLVYHDADRNEQLFPRFTSCVQISLELPSQASSCAWQLAYITPGGLRGGGAVSWYRKGGSVSELIWLMRLKQIATLEAYLQEVSAISLLTDLPLVSRFALRAAAALFRHLDVSLGWRQLAAPSRCALCGCLAPCAAWWHT